MLARIEVEAPRADRLDGPDKDEHAVAQAIRGGIGADRLAGQRIEVVGDRASRTQGEGGQGEHTRSRADVQDLRRHHLIRGHLVQEAQGQSRRGVAPGAEGLARIDDQGRLPGRPPVLQEGRPDGEARRDLHHRQAFAPGTRPVLVLHQGGIPDGAPGTVAERLQDRVRAVRRGVDEEL